MIVRVTNDCIACELCVSVCPEVFEMGDTIAKVTQTPVESAYQAKVLQAVDECPTAAIMTE